MSKTTRSSKRHWPRGVVILHEDRDILVVEKPAGMLTMGTTRFDEDTLYHKLTNYVRKGNSKSRERVFIVHRLDREASGVLVFARNERAKATLQDHWSEAKKRYLAIVHGTPSPKSGVFESFLAENAAHRVYATRDAAQGKLSRTAYRAVRERGGLSLLEIDLLTGRKHQIRVQLADAGHPIVGDRKYGGSEHSRGGGRLKRDNASRRGGEPAPRGREPDSRGRRGARTRGRLALHAVSLSFQHPATGETMSFEARAPKHFAEMGKLSSPSSER